MRLFGHPLHPMLVHFPIALWTVGSLADALKLGGVEGARSIAWLAIGAGDAVALLTMTAGLLDYAELDAAILPVAQRHMGLMGLAWLLYAAAFVWRSDGLAPGMAPILGPALCGFAGFVVLIAGAWHGGQLVYRFGAGVAR